MRLTKKQPLLKDYSLNFDLGKDFEDKSVEMVNKLGQLEEIEDELGIDLITLFKATKEVWYKQTMIDYDVGGNWYKELDSKTIIHNSIVSRIDFQYKSIYIKGIKKWVDIKDYGKTWALTKGELL